MAAPETQFYINNKDRILSDSALGLPGRHTNNTMPRVFYVAKGGHDGNPGTRTYPLLTVQAAVNKAVDARGDMILIGPGEYTEDVVVLDKSLRFVGSGRGLGVGGTTLMGATSGGKCLYLHATTLNMVVDLENLRLSSHSSTNSVALHMHRDTSGLGGTWRDVAFAGDETTGTKGAWLQGVTRLYSYGCIFDAFEIALALDGSALPSMRIWFEDTTFYDNITADIATTSSGALGSQNIARCSFFRNRHIDWGGTPVTDFINIAGTHTQVAFFDAWFARAAADGGTLELAAGDIVLGRDPAGLVSVTGV